MAEGHASDPLDRVALRRGGDKNSPYTDAVMLFILSVTLDRHWNPGALDLLSPAHSVRLSVS